MALKPRMLHNTRYKPKHSRGRIGCCAVYTFRLMFGQLLSAVSDDHELGRRFRSIIQPLPVLSCGRSFRRFCAC